MAEKKRAPLTDLDVEVLKGARDGRLWRSESGYDLYTTYLDALGRSTKVNRQADKLGKSSNGEPLIRTGERAGVRTPWLLTEAGVAELAKREG